MLAPELVILGLKVAVSAVTLLLIASLVVLAAGSPRWHGRINRVFFGLTVATVLGFEFLIRFVQPNLTASFSPEQREALNIHLCFSVPSALLLPPMLYTGTRRLKTAHVALAIVFSILWIGTVVTGVFFLPHSFCCAMTEPEPDADELAAARRLGESYATLVGASEWQLDVSLGGPGASAIGIPPEPIPPVANAPDSSKTPPLAEAVNEPTVPPGPIQILEALLFVGGPPLTAKDAADAIRGLSAEQFRECIDTLNRLYRVQNRPYAVVHGSTGYVLRVSRKYAAVRERLYGGPREARLNQPALDVLSLIAYRQPTTKEEIDGARGADSGGVVRQLVRLGLIAHEAGEAGEMLYRTTGKFLEVFRLRDLEDLPEIGEPNRVG